MERSVSVSSDQNIREHLRRWPTYLGRNISTEIRRSIVDQPVLCPNRTLSRNAETKDFARLASHPVRGWTGKNKAFCSPATQNGRRVIKVY